MKKPEELNSRMVKEYGSQAGALVIGIASSGDFHSAPEGFRPADVMEGCVSVIILGHPFPQEAILDDPAGYIDIRNAINERMNDIAKNVAKRIREKGYRTKTISGAGGKWVDGKQFGFISLKHAAELAGIGTIGRNYLLISPEHGNLLWFSAVLTDAHLVPDEKIQSICDNCNKCVEACPSGALNDLASFGRKGCSDRMFKMVNGKWELRCFLCRKICPHRFGE
ncbi:MAG: 4Fe-4S binding protein [Methanomassiliicoccaceae archaeon]|nr:4Fe-4S binding protein [Methanomassiliicoccaceae archaeon]